MAEIVIRLDLRVGEGVRKSGRLLLAGALLFSLAPELASESVTLTTYYPAPSGVYTTMITTNNTYLARDAASNGGKVGIGTTSPSLLLHEVYNGANWAALIQSAGAGTASVYMSHSGGYGMYVDAGNAAGAGTYAMDINKNGSPYVYVRGDGLVGIGTANPQQTLDVNGYARISSVNGEGGTIQLAGNNGVGMYVENINGDFRLVNNPWNAELFRVSQAGNLTMQGTEYNWSGGGSGTGYVGAGQLACSPTTYGQSANTTICAAGWYATMQSGFMSKWVALNDGTNGSGDVYCCPCPVINGWPWGTVNGCPNM